VAGRDESSGTAGGGVDSGLVAVSVVIGSELIPSRVEGAAFPESPEAAGVIAMAHYRRRGGERRAAERFQGVGLGFRASYHAGLAAFQGRESVGGEIAFLRKQGFPGALFRLMVYCGYNDSRRLKRVWGRQEANDPRRSGGDWRNVSKYPEVLVASARLSRILRCFIFSLYHVRRLLNLSEVGRLASAGLIRDDTEPNLTRHVLSYFSICFFRVLV
jgi:hypothetical protein